MSQLARNLNSRRLHLGLTVPQVHEALARLGHVVAESTVYGWFNGSRSVRNLEHLRALCTVLETDLNALTEGEIEVVEGPVQAKIAREVADLEPAQQEAVLALIRSMRK